MPRFEALHVTTVQQHAEAEAEGLAAHADDLCVSCEDQVGLDGSQLTDYVVVTDEHDDFWFICVNCAAPLIDPESL